MAFARVNAPVGSHPWLTSERDQIEILMKNTFEDYYYDVQNTLYQLNESLAGIFSKNGCDFAEAFKTPSRMHGMKPRSIKRPALGNMFTPGKPAPKSATPAISRPRNPTPAKAASRSPNPAIARPQNPTPTKAAPKSPLTKASPTSHIPILTPTFKPNGRTLAEELKEATEVSSYNDGTVIHHDIAKSEDGTVIHHEIAKNDDETVIHNDVSPSETPTPKRKSSFAFASLPAREPLKPKASLTSATAEIVRSNDTAATSRGKLVRPAKITVRVQSQLPPQQTPMSEESSTVGGISDWSCSVHGSNSIVYPPARAPGNPRVKALEAAAKKKEEDEHAEKLREERKKETERKRAEEQAELAKKRAEEQAELAKKRAEEQAELAKKRADEQAEMAKKRAEEQAEMTKKRMEEQAEMAKKRAVEHAKLSKKAAEDHEEMSLKAAEEQRQIAAKRYEEHKEAENKRMEQWKKQAESMLWHPEVDAAKKRADARKKELEAKRVQDRKEMEERRVAREARRAEDKLRTARLQEERKALERARAAKKRERQAPEREPLPEMKRQRMGDRDGDSEVQNSIVLPKRQRMGDKDGDVEMQNNVVASKRQRMGDDEDGDVEMQNSVMAAPKRMSNMIRKESTLPKSTSGTLQPPKAAPQGAGRGWLGTKLFGQGRAPPASANRSSMFKATVMAPPPSATRPSMLKATVTTQHQLQSAIKPGAPTHPSQTVQISNARIPFAEVANPPATAQSQTPAQSAHNPAEARSGRENFYPLGLPVEHKRFITPKRLEDFPRTGSELRRYYGLPKNPEVAIEEDVTLPEIFTDSEDDDGEFVPPDWAKPENLKKALRTQQLVDPETIFGPIQPFNLEETFKGYTEPHRLRELRRRGPSGIWNNGDAITSAEKRRDMEAREQLVKDRLAGKSQPQ